MCIPLSLLGNGSVKKLPQQRIHMQRRNCWTRRFQCGPCRIKGQNFELSKFGNWLKSVGEAGSLPYTFLYKTGDGLQLTVRVPCRSLAVSMDTCSFPVLTTGGSTTFKTVTSNLSRCLKGDI
jgi:hypothetical protein